MQKNKKSKVALAIVILVLVIVLLMNGAEILASKKDTAKVPTIFVPTDEVSADQAVAFPTDI